LAGEDSGLDRRDFILLTAAGVTTLVSSVAAADAQEATITLGEANEGGTIYAGDVIEGKKVIRALDVSDLEPGRHHFYFEGVQRVAGQHWYNAVVVVKGASPGKCVALTGGVHGDEMNSIHCIQTVLDLLDPSDMSGTVLAVLDISRPAIEGMTRRWPDSGRGIDLIDMNRWWPGNENGPSAVSRHAWLVFNKLLKPNADYALDFHTAATGMDATAFHLADMTNPDIKAMAELFPIDQIFDDPQYPTLLANALIAEGIPALTPEIGSPRSLDLEMVALFVEGTLNVLRLHGLISSPMGRTGKDSGVFIANTMGASIATHGGFLELLVALKDKVEVGQKVAIQRNAFGEVVAEYTSPVAGQVGARRTDASIEPGTPFLFYLIQTASTAEDEDYPE
jgi:predicted deacylase